MTEEDKEFFKSLHEEQKTFMQTTTKSLDDIQRGLYGDRVNNVPGFAARLKMVEEKLAKLFRERAKVIYMGVGAIGVASALIEAAKLFFK